jgi:sulfatase modifying factor 1
MKNKAEILFAITLLALQACKSPATKTDNKASVTQVTEVKKTYIVKKINFPGSAASMCRPTGLTRSDSATFMEGGGREFKETLFDKPSGVGNIPAGMKFIDGGEFSMGGVNPVGMNGGGHEMMNDARPVHRVGLHSYYRDAT